MLHEIIEKVPLTNPWRDKIQYFDTISSTNDVLKQMALEGAPEGTVLVANMQTGGRGRLGRSFHSPSGLGIYLSVLLRPNCGPKDLMHLTCAAASATCTAIEQSALFRPGIKWTNDLVFQKRKLSGTLTELGLKGDGTAAYAIVGTGVNCNQACEDFPPEIRELAGSLRMFTGKEIDRSLVAAKMIDAYYRMNQALLTNREALLSQYRRDCVTLGQEVSILRGAEVRHGRALDVDEEGALIVKYENGTVEAVNSGEVSVRGLYHYV